MYRPTMYRPTIAGLALLSIAACRAKPPVQVSNGEPVTPTATPVTAAPPAPIHVTYADAESSFTSHDYATAVTKFDAYTKDRTENPWGYYMLGLSAWKAGQLDKARDAFEAVLQRDPQHVKALVNLGRVLLDQDKGSEALERIKDAIAIDSMNGASWRVMGRVEGHLGQVDDALNAYRTAISIDSTDTWSMNNMGVLLIDAGRYPEALGPLARAVQLDSSVATFENNLGIALERTGHFTAAAAAYQSALAADSGYAKAQVSLARVTGRVDAPSTDPVDLAALATAFTQH